MYELLSKTPVDVALLPNKISETIRAVAQVFGSSVPNSLHLLWLISGHLRQFQFIDNDSMAKLLDKLVDLGLIDKRIDTYTPHYHLSDSGQKFLVRFRLEHDTTSAEQYLIDL